MKEDRQKKPKQSSIYVDRTSIVDRGAVIGKGTKIWHYSHVSSGAEIGDNCVLGQNVFIAANVKIGNGVKIQNNVSVYEGVTIEDDAFLGPSCVFTNVKNPRSEFPVGGKYDKTLIKKGATIGANATIVCGSTIGEYSFIGAGSVVTKDIEPYALAYGNPARQHGWVDKNGKTVDRNPTSNTIDFVDLKAQYRAYEEEFNTALLTAVRRADFILGKDVGEFEQELAKYLGSSHVVSCANGTDALMLALKALDIKPGDEVIVPSFTFIATASMVTTLGAKPVFVDVSLDDFNIDPKDVERKITKKTKAVIAVHLFGGVADLAALKKLCKKHKLYLIEDCAQSFGSIYKGKKVGTIGDIGCFSFFPAKNLGAYGDGGALTTKSPRLAKKLRMLRFHGHQRKYYSVLIGHNSRLDTVQAAILKVKLSHIDEEITLRRKSADFYNEKLIANFILQKPSQKDGIFHSFNYYTLRVKNRDALQKYLQKKGIPTMVYYPTPCHLQPVYISKEYKDSFPISEQLSKEVISLPLSPFLRQEDAEYIVKVINKFSS